MASYYTAALIFTALLLLGALHLYAPHSLLAQELVNTPAHELIEMAEDPQSEVRIRAIRELAKRPMSFDTIVPVLARLTASDDSQVSAAAQSSLSEIGESGVEMLRPLFEEKTKTASLIACSAAHSIGPPSKIFLPEIKKLLEDGDRVERRAALFVLKGIGDSNVELLDEVIVSLSDINFNVRCMACRVIQSYGPKASKAEPKLLEMLDKGMPSIRGFSALCLASIGPKLKSKDVADKIAKKLKGDGIRPVTPVVHGRYLVALTLLGDESKKHLDLIRKGLDHHSTLVKANSAFAIYQISGESMETEELVERLLKDETRAPELLGLIGKLKDDAAPFVPAVSRSLGSASPATREMALVALMELGIEDPAIIKKVEAMLDDPNEDVSNTAKEALESLKPKKDPSATAE